LTLEAVRRPAGSVELVADGPRWCLILTGDFDVDNCDAIVDAIRRVVREPAPTIDVDLSGVSLLSSAAVAALLQAASLVDSQHGRLELVGVSRAAGRVLGVLGVDHFFGPAGPS
jgi:anti-anti-sigma factor